MKVDLGIISLKVDVWQVILLAVALAGITAALIGFDFGWVTALLGLGSAAKRQNEDGKGTDTKVPERPEPKQEEPTTEYSEKVGEVEQQTAREEVSQMSDDEVFQELRESDEL